MDSILTSVKKLLGIDEECTDFDIDIIIHINSVFVILNQLGVGSKIFSIEDDTATWRDYLGEGYDDLSFVKTYMYLKVKLLFDPPNGSVLESYKKSIDELEFRINVAVEDGTIGKYFTESDLETISEKGGDS